jgi:hypothetical protein
MDAFRHVDAPVAARLARVFPHATAAQRARAGRIDARPAALEA